MNNSAYKSTRKIVGFNFKGLKPGQWIELEGCKSRGQWLGTTAQGTEVIRWQIENNTFKKADALANKPIRAYAKNYGSR